MIEELSKDCRLAADVLEARGSFPTGQSVLRDAANEIERLRSEREWRDAFVSKPPHEMDVLCYGSGIYEVGYMRVADWDADTQSWHDEEGCHPEGFFSHWMPLPTPPAVSGAEGD